MRGVQYQKFWGASRWCRQILLWLAANDSFSVLLMSCTAIYAYSAARKKRHFRYVLANLVTPSKNSMLASHLLSPSPRGFEGGSKMESFQKVHVFEYVAFFQYPFQYTFLPNRVFKGALCLLVCCFGMPGNTWARQGSVFDLSLAELSNIKVTSISKTEENAFRAPVPIFVITEEDIRRSGATSIPEVLRMAPGIEVARISANKWAITARGFNDQLANKLLVLMDGRSVYNGHFSGVYWDVQDTLLEDIDRIEVIRGPGGSTWGSNAVNGVINIITKQAKATQGTYISATGGTDGGIGEGRYGGMLGDNGYYRSYVKYLDHDNFREMDGHNAFDGWHAGRGGFRVDWDKSPQESFTVQGDAYQGKENEGRTLWLPSLAPPFMQAFPDDDGGKVSGGNVMFKWENTISTTSGTYVQAYIDNAIRDYSYLGQEQNTFDVDFQHHWMVAEKHHVTWGAGGRYTYQSIDESPVFDHLSNHRYDVLYSLFAEDKITLLPETLEAVIGSKLEHNPYTGLEAQPSARLAWFLSEQQTAWAGISRAVRTPNFVEHNFNTIVSVMPPGTLGTGTPAGFVKWQGNPAMESETLIAYELGYRARPTNKFSVDVTGYYHDFNRLATLERSALFPAPDMAFFLRFDNRASGEVYGAEVSATYDAAENWRLVSAYTLSRLSLHRDAGSTDNLEEPLEGRTPRNKVSLHSYWNVTEELMVDNGVYFVDNLSGIPAYMRVDARVAWQPVAVVELGLVGQNVFDHAHPEFPESLLASPTEVPRAVFGYVAWRF